MLAGAGLLELLAVLVAAGLLSPPPDDDSQVGESRAEPLAEIAGVSQASGGQATRCRSSAGSSSATISRSSARQGLRGDQLHSPSGRVEQLFEHLERDGVGFVSCRAAEDHAWRRRRIGGPDPAWRSPR